MDVELMNKLMFMGNDLCTAIEEAEDPMVQSAVLFFLMSRVKQTASKMNTDL